ncbi:amidase [Paenibacillus sp. PK3_47]|uniref:amidase n=1 Tax=Paenibacillus sp. PK3_47 TaxID=2072642 RepID=UPI00201DC2F4|nr:amidase [Paenibacillus sp. PK3_47]UQZ35967.1 amidase [Paenibacillus sp. PK3_47]
MQLARSSLTAMLSENNEPETSLNQSMELFMQRFEKLEPHVRAFVPEDKPEQRMTQEAERLLTYAGSRDSLPPLWGIPVGIKDLIHVEGLPTRAGSRMPAETLTGKEGFLIRRLRAAGAWIAGKTVTEEFAYQGPIATLNPHNPAHTPGGSSAGSAAAVAAGICPLAVGTQSLRSVMAPASFCGVAGFKPSYGRVPLDGVLLLSPSFDTVGFFTQELESMEAAVKVLVPDWVPRRAEHKPVLGIPRGVYMQLMSDEVREVFKGQIEGLMRMGYQVKHVDMPWEDDFIYGDAMLRLVEGELARGHADWFGSYEEYYGAGVKDAILRGAKIQEEELAGYRGMQLELRQALAALMDREGIDLWVSPAQGMTAPRLEEHSTGRSGMTAIWGFAGCPAISLPSAEINGLPLGFQCIGQYGTDEWLLAWAREVSQDLSYSNESR